MIPAFARTVWQIGNRISHGCIRIFCAGPVSRSRERSPFAELFGPVAEVFMNSQQEESAAVLRNAEPHSIQQLRKDDVTRSLHLACDGGYDGWPFLARFAFARPENPLNVFHQKNAGLEPPYVS